MFLEIFPRQNSDSNSDRCRYSKTQAHQAEAASNRGQWIDKILRDQMIRKIKCEHVNQIESITDFSKKSQDSWLD